MEAAVGPKHAIEGLVVAAVESLLKVILHASSVVRMHDPEKLIGGSGEGFRPGSQQLMHSGVPVPLVRRDVPLERAHSGRSQRQVEASQVLMEGLVGFLAFGDVANVALDHLVVVH